MAHVIRTIEELVEKVKAGQTIWELCVCLDGPIRSSLRIITAIHLDTANYSYTDSIGNTYAGWSMKDLVGDQRYCNYGPYMGVCLTEQDAQEAYEANMRHFEENGRSPEDEEW